MGDIFDVRWPSNAIISDGRQPFVQRAGVCDELFQSSALAVAWIVCPQSWNSLVTNFRVC